MRSNEQRVIEKIRLLFFIVNELICDIIKQINKSELTELKDRDTSCLNDKKLKRYHNEKYKV